MKKILLVAPTPAIYERAKATIEQHQFQEIEVQFGNLMDGVHIAEEFIRNGGKIIISRGGTYKVIQEYISAPVLEIKVSVDDCIDAYRKVRPGTDPVGVIGFSNVVSGFRQLAHICPRPFRFQEVRKEDEVPNAVNAFLKEGIQSFIGDAIGTLTLQKFHCDCVMVDSETEDIVSTIREAENILDIAQQQINRSQELHDIMNSVQDGVVYTESSGLIRWMNSAARLWFPWIQPGGTMQELLGSSQLPPAPDRGRIFRIRDRSYIASITPMEMAQSNHGLVFSFQRTEEISNMERNVRKSQRNSGFEAKYTFQNIIHVSDLIERTIEKAKKFAEVDTPILISGETGTGKELLCQGIHNWSPRRRELFVAVNCAAISPSLMEAEFFGYADGAFTGARKTGKAGIFELAHGGTLFLDEISELPMALQGRLLRVLQEKQVMRLGDDKVIPVDVRIICSSNKNLQQMVADGLFRADLYFRIAVLRLNSPSLAERREDILPIAEHFLKIYTKEHHKEPMELTPPVRERLISRNYLGNIRELKDLIEESVILGSFDEILSENLPKNQSGVPFTCSSEAPNTVSPSTALPGTLVTLTEYEDQYIRHIYQCTGQNIQETCQILGISRSTLWRRLRSISN